MTLAGEDEAEFDEDVQYDEVSIPADTTRLGQRLWLVKVPKFLSQVLLNKDLTDRSGVARLQFDNWRTTPGRGIKFVLDQGIAEKNGVPKEYILKLKAEPRDQVCAFVNSIADNATKYSIGGRITSSHDAQLVIDDSYLSMKKNQIQIKNTPERKIQQISQVRKIKPVSVVQEIARVKKNPENKKCRSEKEDVYNMLFRAFEKHQYYNIRDLVNITQQPVSFLKEVMKELCVYCTRMPYKNMWELKPEYRHYSQGEDRQ